MQPANQAAADCRAVASFGLEHRSDENLVAMVRSGSERAYEEILRRYRRPLQAYCAQRLGPNRAEDAVQQAFMQAYMSLRRGGENRIALRPWLYRIAHNCSIDMLRKNGWDYEQLDPDFDGVPQPPNLLEQKEELERMVSSIRGLPESQRRALTLREIEGRSYREIADQLGHSESAVRQLIFRGRTALRKVGVAMLVPVGLIRDRAASVAPAADAQGAAFVASAGGEPVGTSISQAGASLLAGVVVFAGAGAAESDHQKAVPQSGGEDVPAMVGTAPAAGASTSKSTAAKAKRGSLAGTKVRVDEQGKVELVPVSTGAPATAPAATEVPAAPATESSAPAAAPSTPSTVPDDSTPKAKGPKVAKPAPAEKAPKVEKAPKAEKAPKVEKPAKPEKAPKAERAPKSNNASAPKEKPRQVPAKQSVPRETPTPRSEVNATPKRGGPTGTSNLTSQAKGSNNGTQGPKQKTTTDQARGSASGGSR